MIHSETNLSPEVWTVLSTLCMFPARTIPSTRIHILEYSSGANPDINPAFIEVRVLVLLQGHTLIVSSLPENPPWQSDSDSL